ncbi:MAG: hypothetical protein BroJett040_14210 [Oligoflexia bacterium]|nr:MAG: hypothetical protein BroJett040_14210 [Oligoflexia bacterium]
MRKLQSSALFAAFVCLFAGHNLYAMAVDWAGTYRFEYVEVDKTYLSSDPGGRKSYFLNHLNLSPKIIAADGINVVANFEVLPSQQYPNSQLGQNFGTGMGTAGGESSTASTNQNSSSLQVTQLYVNVNHEYGALLAGRTPLHFGMGITQNAGNGLFDHWSNVHDVVGYKFLIGNLSIMPMIGKPYRESFAQGSETGEMIWDILYTNPETESTFGVFHQTRTSSISGNDAGKVFQRVYSGATTTGGWSTTHTNVLLGRGWESFKFKLEAGFNSGNTGISTSTGEAIKLNGYGIAMELDFPRPESKYHWTVRTGIASGDNPKTEAFEGYFFNRNYDVAFLMFNHPMGKYDMFRTGLQRQGDVTCTTAPCSAYANDRSADEETISNAIYFSPKMSYSMGDKWEFLSSLTWAQLQTNPSATFDDVSKDVGFEWDLGFQYKPQEKIRWLTEVGMLFPGAAWQEGGANRDHAFNLGIQTKAAISF